MGVFSDIRADLERSATKLLDEYKDRLMADALRLCKNEADAEDLVMRTFEKYFFDQSKYDPARGSMLTWLRTVMRNLQTDSLRRRKVEEVVLPPEEIEQLTDGRLPEGASEDPEQAAQEERELLKAINGLSPKIREAVILHYFELLPITKVAKTLCVSEDSIKNRLYYARKVLLKRLPRVLGKKPLAVILIALVSLVSAAAVATLPAFEPLRETVSSWFGSVDASEEDIRSGGVGGVVGGGGVSPAQNTEKWSGSVDAESWGGGVSPAQNKNVTQENAIHETQIQEKPTMKLTQTFAAAALAATTAVIGAVEADGVTLESVQARQRYPWNGLVDIDYTITYDNGATLDVDDNLEVMLVDHDVEPAVTNRAITFLQAPLPMTEGSHRITWDANADGVTGRIDKAQFVMKIRHYSEVYMVIDVSGGSSTNCYPVDFLNGAPPNGFTDPEYKGNKIVLRRIHPGSYIAGSPSSPAEANRTAAREKQHRVALSQPFYIGIYEITQKQYKNVMGTDPSTYKGDYRPVEMVSYNTIRGTANTSTHVNDWPWNDGVDSNSFMGKLRSKCKAKGSDGNYTEPVEGFDLPTEFQWEYACRAGTTGALNTTNEYANTTAAQEEQLRLLGRYTNNQTDGKGGYDANHTNVGSYQPNQWGLYDMHGNVWEWCRDWYQEDATALKQFTDPKGAASGSYRVGRGGGWDDTVGYCRSAFRGSYLSPSLAYAYLGFRLSRTLPKQNAR